MILRVRNEAAHVSSKKSMESDLDSFNNTNPPVIFSREADEQFRGEIIKGKKSIFNVKLCRPGSLMTGQTRFVRGGLRTVCVI